MEPPITNNQSPVTGSDTGSDPPITSYQSPVTDREDDETSLLDLLIVLAKHKWLVLGLPFITAIVAVIYVLILPNIYTATTKIFVPQTQTATSAIASQIGSLGAMAGGLVGMRNPNDLYIALLRSRTVADNLIQRFDLNKLYEEKYQSETRKRLFSARRRMLPSMKATSHFDLLLVRMMSPTFSGSPGRAGTASLPGAVTSTFPSTLVNLPTGAAWAKVGNISNKAKREMMMDFLFMTLPP